MDKRGAKKMGVCDDLISRQAAIDLIHKTIYGFFDIVDNESEEPMGEKDKLLLEVNKAVSNGTKELPSAQPKRKKGKWVKQNPFVDTEECSLCKYNIYSEELETPFCPWCGAEMEEDECKKQQ